MAAGSQEGRIGNGSLESTDRSFQGAYNLKEGYVGHGMTERVAYHFGKLQKMLADISYEDRLHLTSIDLTSHNAINEDKKDEISRQLCKLWSGTGEIPQKAATMLPPMCHHKCET
ncbi:uncharacterized protein BT62DRAFT_921995 [Guyanagaster necrorhizus]|uniref:Uncharacterized protein n=1 Tax=Guyanagaster necrorhizus TaxID=856835 RepID=A0A9P7VLS8_9AGAR|nr:uncharacterized protein BT62DRAFT_921995 [Guyanagaster necrorhizus MCA 3950]KAG7443536.1 hypothetical protein BT62DRAFT_921995 [Guyanagaster necrorhizus MCA 3950]